MKRITLVLLTALACTTALWAQHVTWQPTAPRVGDVVTISYDSRIGPLGPATAALWLHWGVLDPGTGTWSTPPEAIWPAGSHLHSDNVAVQSPMTRGQDTVWTITIDFDTTVEDIAFVFTDGQNNWDNNNGNNWVIHFMQSGTVSWWTPEEPEPGDVVTIFYDAVPGTLPNGATSAILHWGINEAGHGNWRLPPQAMWPAGTVASGVAAQSPMTSLGNGLFQIVITTLDTIYSLHYVVTDLTNWDNNNNLNWDIFLEEPPVPVYTHVVFRFDPRSAFSTFQGTISSLNLAGTFNGWSTSATPLTNFDSYGNRWGEVLIPVGDTEYKFVINGSNWQIDPDNPRNAPGGYNNSLITLTPDSLPQVYNVQPGENRVYAAGTDVTVSVKVRPGDFGQGISGTPVAHVNGTIWTSNWNVGTSTLTLNPLPSAAGYVDVEISATDSAGRTGTRHLAYGFKSSGYLTVDPLDDYNYHIEEGNSPESDLKYLAMRERASGDSIEFEIGVGVFSIHEVLIVLTVSSSADAWSEMPNFGGDVHVPGLEAGGAAIPLLPAGATYYDVAVHNRVHPAGDFAQTGPQVLLTTDDVAGRWTAVVSVDDLEDCLGSYQSAWYFTCTTYEAQSAAEGYCLDPTAGHGGTEGEEDPDCWDAIGFQAADIQPKMMKNYGLTRRATLDAPGRGVANVLPTDIGPNIAAAGPICRILTRGAPTIDSTQSVTGRVTSTIAVTSVWLTHNSAVTPVTLSGDTFTVPVILHEGLNQFNVWAVDTNSDTGRSPTMTFTLVVEHAPHAIATAYIDVDGYSVLSASSSTDPENQQLTYLWTADADNPGQSDIMSPTEGASMVGLDTIPGEYYFDLVVTDSDQNVGYARTFFTVTPDSMHGFSNDECASWVENTIMYEIFVRSFSPAGNLDGVTERMDYIAGLGVNCIWLMPIFEGPSDHGYEITDYYTVEQDYGTAEDLQELVDAAHARGIRVILDMVLNHTGIGHPFMQEAQRYGRYSHYWDYYDRDAAGNYTYYFDWTSLPNLNLNNSETVKYFIDMCKYWITEFGIDGYRCDVAWGPQQRSPQFWVQWRRALKEIKPEVLLLAESGANDFTIFTNRFDQAFDWNLHHEGTASFANMFPQIPNFSQLTDLVNNYNYWWPAYKDPLRFMENHDEGRYIASNTAAQAKLVSSFMMSIPGAVMLYAGQEIGTRSQRGMITWGSDPDQMYSHYYRITNARKLLPALRSGTFSVLANNQGGTCYSFARYGSGMDPLVFVGNFAPSSSVVTVTVSPSQLGLHPDSTYVVSELLGGVTYSVQGSQFNSLVTSLSQYQSRLWVISDSAISVDAPPSRPAVPQQMTLGPAYPNPFNPTTVLPLTLPARANVSLRIYDILGREVATLVDGALEAGEYHLTWNSSGRGSGVYFAVLRTSSAQQVRKLVLMR